MKMEDDLLQMLGEDLRDRRDRVERGDAPAELHDSLGVEEQEAVLDATFDQLHSQQPAESSELAEVVPMAPRRERATGIAVVGALLAVAAAVLLWWGLPRTNSDAEVVVSLPRYVVTLLHAGEASHRSAPEAALAWIELAPDGPIELMLTPTTPVREPLAVVLVARRVGEAPTLVRLSEGVEISANGGVRISGRLDRFVTLAAGSWTLEILVGPPTVLPEDGSALSSAPKPPPWRKIVVHATIVSPR